MRNKLLLLIFSTLFLYSCNGGSAPASDIPTSLKASSMFKPKVTDCTAFGGVQARVRLATQELNEGNVEIVCGTTLSEPLRNNVENKKTSKKVEYELNVVDDSEKIVKFCEKDEDGTPYLGIYVTGAFVNSKDITNIDGDKFFHENVICITGPNAGNSTDNETEGPVIPDPEPGDNGTGDNGTGGVDPEKPDPDIDSGNIITEGSPLLDSILYTDFGNYKGSTNRTFVVLRNIGTKPISVEGNPMLSNFSGGNTAFQMRYPSNCADKVIKGGDACYTEINFNPKFANKQDNLSAELTVKLKDGDVISAVSGLHATKNNEGYSKVVPTVGNVPAYSIGGKKGSIVGIVNDIHIFGGIAVDNLTFRDEHYSFNTVRKTWKHLTTTDNKPSARHSHASAVVGYNMYVFGGIDKDNSAGLNDFYVYNSDKDKWSKLASPLAEITPRYGMTLTAVGTRLYMFGGFQNGVAVDNILYMYDTTTSKWTSFGISPMSKRGYHQATLDTTLDPKTIYFYGGINTAEPIDEKVIYTFNTKSNLWQSTVPATWQQLASTVASDFYMLPFGDHIVLTPGKDKGGNVTAAYSFKRNTQASASWVRTEWKITYSFPIFDSVKTYAISNNGAAYLFKFSDTDTKPVEVYSYHHKAQ